MRQVKENEIRTPRQGAMVGTKAMVGDKPVAVVKQGKKIDTLTLDEFATALYGQDVKCVIVKNKTS